MTSISVRSSYRNVLREAYKSSILPRKSRNPTIALNFRRFFEDTGRSRASSLSHDAENAALFMRNQREYSELLKRYNPLHDMSPEEHREATAHRVGLNMPEEFDGESR